MLHFMYIAFRNIFRHKRRTIFTVTTIVIGVAMLLVAKSFLTGLQREMVQGSAEILSGEMQIHSADYANSLDMMPLDKVMNITEDIDPKIKTITDITAYTYRIRLAGIISRGEIATGSSGLKMNEKDLMDEAPSGLEEKVKIDLNKESVGKKKTASIISSQFLAVGIDPENEVKVCPRILNALNEGRFLKKEDNAMTKSYETVGLLNAQLMKGLNLKVGDTVVLMPWDVNVKIVGVLNIELPTIDKKLVYLPLAAAKQMLYERNYAENNNSVHEIVFKTKDINTKDKSIEELKKIFSDKNWKVQGWEEFLGFFSDVRKIQNIIYWVILAIILLIVSTGIINTSLMSVMERTREIGTLMSMGYKRKHIVQLFLFENISIGLLGGAIGVFIGLVIVGILNVVGINFVIPGTITAFNLRPEISVGFVLVDFGFAFLASLFAGLYPSIHASKLKPVDALSTN